MANGPFKILLSYNIPPENQERYYRWVTGHFMPQTHQMGLELTEVWETAWGEYPSRLIALVGSNRDTVNTALASEQWKQLEKRLKGYVTNYSRRVMPYRPHFQF